MDEATDSAINGPVTESAVRSESLSDQTIQALTADITSRELSTESVEDDIAELIKISSQGLREGVLGNEGTNDLRVLIAAGLAGAHNPNVINGLVGGATRLDLFNNTDISTIKHIIEVSSTGLASTLLGQEGAKDVRVMLAASVAGAHNQNVINGLIGSATVLKMNRDTPEVDLAHAIRVASDGLSERLGTEATQDLRVMIAATAATSK